MLVDDRGISRLSSGSDAPFQDTVLERRKFMFLFVVVHRGRQVRRVAVQPVRCDGSTEFSMGWSQLQRKTSCTSIQRLPFSHASTSQRGNNGFGSGPR